MKYKQVKTVFTQPHQVLNTKPKYRICGIYFDAVWYEKIAVLLLVVCWLFINNIYWPSNAFLQYCKSYSSSWCKAEQIHAIINVQFLYKKIFKSYCDSVCLPLLSFGDVQLAGSMFWPIILRYIVKNFHVIKIGKKAEHGLRNEWQNMNGCEVQELLINRCISWRWESERQYSHCTRWHRLPQWVSTGPPTWWVPRWERRRSLQLQEPWHEYCSQHTDSLWTVLNLFSFFRNWISAFSWRKFLSCSLDNSD